MAYRTAGVESLVYGFILKWSADHSGNTPTIRVIQTQCQVSSTSMVNFYLKRLIGRGLLEKRDGELCVVGATWTPPFMSRVTVVEKTGRWANPMVKGEKL